MFLWNIWNSGGGPTSTKNHVLHRFTNICKRKMFTSLGLALKNKWINKYIHWCHVPLYYAQVKRKVWSCYSSVPIFFFLFWWLNVGLLPGKKVFYYLSYTSRPFAFILFLRKGIAAFLPGLTLNLNHPPVFVSQVPGIIGMHHPAWL
jgi:hypothetical protein